MVEREAVGGDGDQGFVASSYLSTQHYWLQTEEADTETISWFSM